MKRWRRAFAVTWLLVAGLDGAVRGAEAPAGATACSGCHGASAEANAPVPRLLGRNPDEIVGAVRAFRSGQREGTVMGRIAKGFSDDEIRAIAAWLAAQH
jgi:cytochrome subunit of sulfide dehydrogenase